MYISRLVPAINSRRHAKSIHHAEPVIIMLTDFSDSLLAPQDCVTFAGSADPLGAETAPVPITPS